MITGYEDTNSGYTNNHADWMSERTSSHRE